MAVFLVIAYVNTVVIWQAISRLTGAGFRDAIPVLVFALLFVMIGAFAWVSRRRSGGAIGWKVIAAALLVAVVGLASTDPAFPAKRIHVPQYLVLAVLLSFSLPRRVRTGRTLLFVFLATALYGVHDEFLQGLHPSRTFGLRDMFINLCGAGAGALTARAFSAAGAPAPQNSGDPAGMRPVALGLILLLVGVGLFAYARTGYRNDLLPYWTVLPVIAAALMLALALEHLPSPGDRLALRPLVGIGLLFAVYPLLINIVVLEFA